MSISTFNSGDLAKAVRIAVQLIASSPEYHSTNVARKTGLPMQLSGYTSTPPDPYKVSYILQHFFVKQKLATIIHGLFNISQPLGYCLLLYGWRC